MFVIGIDPHRGSHVAAVLDSDERVRAVLRLPADRQQRGRLLSWASEFTPRRWAVEGATGTGAVLAQQLVAAARPWSTCHRSWPLGSGCWTATTATRPIPTTLALSRSSLCAPAGWRRSPPRITAQCCGCWPSVTTISSPPAPGLSAGWTPPCAFERYVATDHVPPLQQRLDALDTWRRFARGDKLNVLRLAEIVDTLSNIDGDHGYYRSLADAVEQHCLDAGIHLPTPEPERPGIEPPGLDIGL